MFLRILQRFKRNLQHFSMTHIVQDRNNVLVDANNSVLEAKLVLRDTNNWNILKVGLNPGLWTYPLPPKKLVWTLGSLSPPPPEKNSPTPPPFKGL